MSRGKTIIDTDAGIDDAMAVFLALASEELEIVGLTSCFGNTYVGNSTRNILSILAAAGRDDIPVAEGASRPLAGELSPRSGLFHGEDGLGGASGRLPKPSHPPLDVPAARFIVDRVMAEPGAVTIAALGPATNLALAVLLEPAVARCAKRIVLLGGAFGVPGNATPAAEANFHNDPEAARIVCGAGWDVTLIGLDVTTKVEMPRDFVAGICSRPSRPAAFIAEIVPYYQAAYARQHGMGNSIFCHDATLVAYLIRPELFDVEPRIPICVVTEGRAAGMTIRDNTAAWPDSARVNIGLGARSDAVLSLISGRMA